MNLILDLNLSFECRLSIKFQKLSNTLICKKAYILIAIAILTRLELRKCRFMKMQLFTLTSCLFQNVSRFLTSISRIGFIFLYTAPLKDNFCFYAYKILQNILLSIILILVTILHNMDDIKERKIMTTLMANRQRQTIYNYITYHSKLMATMLDSV